ncbi:MAG: hypothetical protein LUD81_01815, partial [Clostridiales bacterium]|nr:hypothetical protein [Clostridiales bacterium]
KALSLISTQASFSEVKEKVQYIFMNITSGKPSEEVFSNTNSDIQQDILDEIEQNRAMEEQLKNR